MHFSSLLRKRHSRAYAKCSLYSAREIGPPLKINDIFQMLFCEVCISLNNLQCSVAEDVGDLDLACGPEWGHCAERHYLVDPADI